MDKFFPKLDFRRFQVDLSKPLDFLDARNIPVFEELDRQMGQMILNDHFDTNAQGVKTRTVSGSRGPAARPG